MLIKDESGDIFWDMLMFYIYIHTTTNEAARTPSLRAAFTWRGALVLGSSDPKEAKGSQGVVVSVVVVVVLLAR
jgi:hypothetical protein